MESDDQDFYQVDFTTVSDWEIFIARIEEIICQWGLSKGQRDNEEYSSEWTVKMEHLTFKYMKFSLRYYRRRLNDKLIRSDKNDSKIEALEYMMNCENDFQTDESLDENVRHLVQWYGLPDGFLALIPNKYVTIDSENDIKMLSSSFSIAVNNTKCELPIFVQVLEQWQNYFLGLCATKGIFSNYETIHLKKIPPNCKYLTGLLNVFKSRIAVDTFVSSFEPVFISARFSYRLENWDKLAYTVVQSLRDKFADMAAIMGDDQADHPQLRWLPFGSIVEPINTLTLHANWPELLENIVVDSETYSDLEPHSAPVWSLHVRLVEDPECVLSKCIMDYLDKCCTSSSGSVKQLIGDKYERINEPEIQLTDSLNRLTETELPSGISKLLKNVNDMTTVNLKTNNYSAASDPIPNEVLMKSLYFLFPDAEANSRRQYRIVDDDRTIGKDEKKPYSNSNIRNIKSCPVDGLIWRLSSIMLRLMYTKQGIYAMTHLWYEFTQELRYRWENCIRIPGVERKSPDYKTCLLNQKLQLLNCCIEKRTARENPPPLFETGLTDDVCDNAVEDEEEEFYDCQISAAGSNVTAATTDISSSSSSSSNDNKKRSLWNQPVGRKCKCNDSTRLISTGEYMYEPFTQEVAPKTEDQLEEDAAVLEQLGTDPYASELRSKYMSASLCSDMESFKAANPDAVLEDFIRWYSPRDWIEEEDDQYDEYGQKKGHLSARMMLPGNVWREVWDESAPVPACRQKRLFDDTAEAGKVLTFLETLSPAEALRLLLPPIVHIATVVTVQNVNARLSAELLGTETPELLIKKAIHATRDWRFDYGRYKELVSDIANIESVISSYESLQYKLFPDAVLSNLPPDKQTILRRLISGAEVAVSSKDELGNRIFIIFSQMKSRKASNDQQQQQEEFDRNRHDPYSIFPSPHEKYFVLRTRMATPSATSRCLPQKMIAKMSKDQIVMASCFSRDVVYL